jgi:hypothetical protein
MRAPEHAPLYEFLPVRVGQCVEEIFNPLILIRKLRECNFSISRLMILGSPKFLHMLIFGLRVSLALHHYYI